MRVFEPLISEPEGVHAVLHVPSVSGDEFGAVDPHLATIAAEAFSLVIHVAEKLDHGAATGERRCEMLELLTKRRLYDKVFARDEKQEQNGGVAGGGQASVLAERVGGEIEIAGAGTGTFGLGAVDPVFEADEA